MVMGQDHRARAVLERPPHDLPRVDGRMIDRPCAHEIIPDQLVLLVQEEDMELLARKRAKAGAQVEVHRRGAGQHLTIMQGMFEHAQEKAVEQAQFASGGDADQPGEFWLGGAEHSSEAAEAGDQGVGRAEGMGAGDGTSVEEQRKRIALIQGRWSVYG